MQYRTRHLISPNYTHEKLEPPFFKDIVDVFEDRMLHLLINPAKALLKIPHGSVAAVSLATTYMEAIEIYLSGADSKHKSREFFSRGFKAVFDKPTDPEFIGAAFASFLYDLLRCGFAHEGMFRHGIFFSTVRAEAFLITWPKKDGQFDPKGSLESVMINPHKYVEAVERHFLKYVRDLRSLSDSPLKEKFKAAVDLKWELHAPERTIGLTEEEFYRRT